MATLGDILQDNRLIIFKNIQVMNVQGCRGLSQASQVRAAHAPGTEGLFHRLGRYWEK